MGRLKRGAMKMMKGLEHLLDKERLRAGTDQPEEKAQCACINT